MNQLPQKKLVGLNAWFIIEILSFYGYILSAIMFMLLKSASTSLGYQKNAYCQKAYEYDFIQFYRKDLDWLAFCTILFNVNICLICLDQFIIFTPGTQEYQGKTLEFPLKHVQYLLLLNHFL